MPTMESGRIILAALPQSEGKSKLRPALVLKIMPPYNDLLVCGISTQIHQEVIGFDEILDSKDNEFLLSGLVQTSLIRLGYLAILPKLVVAGSIGKVSLQRLKLLKHRLSGFILAD